MNHKGVILIFTYDETVSDALQSVWHNLFFCWSTHSLISKPLANMQNV